MPVDYSYTTYVIPHSKPETINPKPMTRLLSLQTLSPEPFEPGAQCPKPQALSPQTNSGVPPAAQTPDQTPCGVTPARPPALRSAFQACRREGLHLEGTGVFPKKAGSILSSSNQKAEECLSVEVQQRFQLKDPPEAVGCPMAHC